MWRYLIFVGFFLAFNLKGTIAVTDSDNSNIYCKDDYGNYVDWYVVYKFPSKTYDGYMSMTSKTVAQGWTVSNHTIQQPNNMIARTISRMYLKDSKEMWLAYNDNWWWFNKGHAKGILGGDSYGGVWLVHSIPHFPKSGKYGYPTTGKRNAQGALCISLPFRELDKIGDVLKLYGPHYNIKQFSPSMNDVYPTLKSTLDGQKFKNIDSQLSNLTSRGGLEFLTFAKSKSFGKDIYEWIGSALDVSLYVETWRTALMPFPSSCNGPKKIVNVKTIEYAPKRISFSYLIDHSKWAISTDDAPTRYVCIGDINRSKHQLSRGGGSVCLSSPELWKAFFSIIGEKESCESS